MIKKEMIAMLLAGGQGSRLGVLTAKVAKPAVSFGGKYRIIDFPLSNCINSGVDTVGVLTQYQPLRLNTHIGIGIPWDLDKNVGGVSILPPYEKKTDTEWYTGTANAIYQNMAYMETFNPDYVLILGGDHIYKMDYEVMLDYHKANKADVTLACMPVPWEEASRFGLAITDESGRITDFEEKPLMAQSNTISTGVYVIRRRQLIEMLEKAAEENRFDFVADVLIRYRNIKRIYGFKVRDYWSNIASTEDYFRTNMDFLKPEVREYFFRQEPKIYSKVDDLPPAKYNSGSDISNSLISSGCIINGRVENSVLFKKVFIGKNCVIKNSIILNDAYIGDNTHVENCIVESRGTLKANTYYCGENGILVVSENNERYML